MVFAFGPFRADRTTYQVSQGDQVLDLTPKLLDLLFYFLERPAMLITKEDLLDGVWPGANVTENALAQAISDLRDALGDAAAAPTYIRTVARRGYRFVAPVSAAAATAGAAAPDRAPVAPPLRPPQAGAGGGRTIAVSDFVNVTSDPGVDWLAAGIAETVTSDLAALGHFRVIDRWRVVQAARRLGGAPLHELASALGAALVVTGSYQRQGAHLRITARVIDIEHGEALADAKVDGRLDDVFALQDEVVSGFARELGVSDTRVSRRAGVRETSSLDAYRAYMEGWLKIESLDTDRVTASIEDFRRALAADPGYAMAYTGLANAEFVAFEMTRADESPNMAALASGIGHARRAIALDPNLAEAHAALSFLLSGQGAFDAARHAAEQAVHLAPDDWRQQFRLGHASWGQARLGALARALAFYPDFAYAQFERAMVLVARGEFAAAATIARDSVAAQDRDARSANRFPAIGFHWLSGALAAADGRHDAAIDHFDREIALIDHRRLYGPEYGAAALVGRAHAELALGRVESSLRSFQDAERHVRGYARAVVGQLAAFERLGRARDAAAARDRVARATAGLRSTGRAAEAALVEASAALVAGGDAAAESAAALLHRWLDGAPVSPFGWWIPLEPGLASLRGRPEFQRLLSRIAERAR
jgi:DNA-binding winged helix-turn-helix (wHTH) protein